MSANYKNTKGELIAIYRLEFYKKQKNWKLCHDEKKKKKPSEPSAKVVALDKTYNIDSEEPPVESPTPHNDAFLEDDSDKNISSPSIELPKVPSPQAGLNQSLNLQELKINEHNTWTEADNNWLTPIESHQQQNYIIEPVKECNSEWWSGPVESMQQTVSLDPLVDKWTPADYGIEYVYQWQGVEEGQPLSAPESFPAVVCTCGGLPQLVQEDHIADNRTDEARCEEPTEVRRSRRAGEVLSALHTADNGLRTDDASLFEWEPSDVSTDSACSFIRGAHSAPHSSELELRYTTCSCAVESSQLIRLPFEELVSRLKQHAALVKRLLRELHARDNQQTTYKPPTNVSEEQPTRDTGPFIPESVQPPLPQQPPLISSLPHQFPTRLSFPLVDPFVAGSFMNIELPEGRGRGRRLIGIGMGRPYRL